MYHKIESTRPKVDAFVYNVEDGVRAEDKVKARGEAARALREIDHGSPNDLVVFTRSNQLDGPLGREHFEQDVRTIMSAGGKAGGRQVDVIMLPKVESERDMLTLKALVEACEAEFEYKSPVLLSFILETALGVENIREIVRAMGDRGHSGHLGPADLAADLGMDTICVGGHHPNANLLVGPAPTDEDELDTRQLVPVNLWTYYISRLVTSCKAGGIMPFYGPFGEVKDARSSEVQFRTMCTFGAVGGWSLYPAQIGAATRAFSPTAKGVGLSVETFLAMQGGGAGVRSDGQLMDEAVEKQAIVLLRRAMRIAAKDEARRKKYEKVPGYLEAVELLDA